MQITDEFSWNSIKSDFNYIQIQFQKSKQLTFDFNLIEINF